MPGISVSPLAVVSQIKSNLQDRYESGYPILKELLQNADDAESRRFRLDVSSGWRDADNPLLRGPGLLVVNDGAFSDADRRGILSFGESVKAADRATIGKFGLGQKAVFHLCDAFVVHAVGDDKTFSEVVNPFLEVDVAGNVTGGWERFSDCDVARLRGAAEDFRERALILWLPFRRDGLIPAPDAGFSTVQPDSETIVKELARTDDLQVLLTALRHLKSIEIRRQGETLCSVSVDDAQERLRGPHDYPCTRSFHGRIDTGQNDSARFVGREATTQDDDLERLRCSDHWPKTISALSAESVREKGEQHGAATLLRVRNDNTQPSELRISWAVFLPISETEDHVLPIDMAEFGQMHLLLHGCFFLDSGRRQIEGLADSVNHDEPADEAGLRCAWNTRLRDTVVLSLVPALLMDALNQGMMTAKELTHLVVALAKCPSFRNYRTGICKENALVRVLKGAAVRPAERVAWRLVPTGFELRYLPAILADRPELVDKLFEDIDRWAQDRNITLCIDRCASLTAQPMRWAVKELASLCATLSPRAFQSEPLATLLTHLLSEADLNNEDQIKLAPHLVNALRRAMCESTRMAPSFHLSNILRHVPRDRFFALPKSVEHRQILCAMASSNAEILPVRGELLDTTDNQSPLSENDLNVLLRALDPLIDGVAETTARQAAAAALALLGGMEISALASQEEFKDIKILRGRNPVTGDIVVLSFVELLARSRKKFLFRHSPGVEERLRTLVEALPDAQPLIVDADSETGVHCLTSTANKNAFFDLIMSTSTFGPKSRRAQMIGMLSGLGGNDQPVALRKLCAGDRNAGELNAKLWNADSLPTELDRVIDSIFMQREYEFLVPSSIMSVLAPSKRQELRIQDLDTPRLERLIEGSIDTFTELHLTKPERNEFLKTNLPHKLLRRLPIHDRSDGTVGSAEGLFREDAEWPIPDRLGGRGLTVKLSDDPEIHSKQKCIIPIWSPQEQIRTALSQPEPHRYPEEILDAISRSCRNEADNLPALLDQLRTKRWLVVDGTPVVPKDVLALPSLVDKATQPYLSDSLRCIAVGRLPERIRTHRGFQYVAKRVIRNQRSSVAELARIIDAVRLQGRLGSAEDYPIAQFTELANMGADLELPGWPLLAAVLSSIDDDVDVHKVVGSFHEVPHAESHVAARHLNAMAEVARHDAAHQAAAERAYHHAFEAVAKWAWDDRRRVFGNTLVPTESREWRSGKEVCAEGIGVAPAHMLVGECAAMLPARNEVLSDHEVGDAAGPDDEIFDIEVLRKKSVEQHRAFLEEWRGSIPPELVAVYLGIVGRHTPSIKAYHEEWTKDATVSLDHEIEKLGRDVRMPALFLIEEIGGASVKAISLSGDRFRAPLDNHISSELVLGNLHRKKIFVSTPSQNKRTRIIKMQLRTTDHRALPFRKRVQHFCEFVETIAAECLSCEAMDRLRRILNRAHVDQATLQDIERLLRDRLLLYMLEALKLPAQSSAFHALRRYEAEETRASDDDKVDLKEKLWQSMREPAVAAEVLAAVRARIRDQGYCARRVLFELFQNADDAYVQRESGSESACFRVDFGSSDDDRLRIVHWGRPINHLGSNVEAGRRCGYDRDLLNMLVMSFSDKRPEERLNGKFGLGFKCVHLLSDNVGIASGFIALRVAGGILPREWPDGLRLAEECSSSDRGRATVIDIPYTTEKMAEDGGRAEQMFRDAMTWLLAFARRIRRIEVLGSAQRTIDCKMSSFSGDGSIDIVAIQDVRQPQRALRLDLGNDYSLLLKIGAEGPECFELSVGPVWNLTPLEEDLRSGWLLNGPFPVDPGRGRLAGSIEDRRGRFADLGLALGERLLELYDLVDRDWEALANALVLSAAGSDAQGRFWHGLFDVVSRDLDDDNPARCLHALDRGYGRLVAERPVAPTRLPRPFDSLVSASSVNSFTDKALAGEGILEATQEWESAARLKDRIVASEVATRLERLGFKNIQPVTLSDLLRIEMREDKRIDVNLGTRLGHVITQAAIEKEPLRQERGEILKAASQARFCAQDDTWRPVSHLNSKQGGDDETLLCDFAPDDALLHEEYQDESLEFFKVARMQSGYGGLRVPLLRKWVYSARDESRQRAALRYLERGRSGPDLAQSLRNNLPTWMENVSEQFLSHPLLEGWTDEERKRLVVGLDPSRLEVASPTPPHYVFPASDVSKIMEKLHEWWMAERRSERLRYAKSVYPERFNKNSLSNVPIDRMAWFTMFALACYQLFGRTQDEQHRSFIECGWSEGWWAELSQSEPPGDFQPWRDRLKRWSAADRFDQTSHHWERTLVDLYTIARWLNEYVGLTLKLPRIVEEHRHTPLDAILRPTYSPLVGPLGLDAAPIDRSLGIGANWLIRELSRNGVYAPSDTSLMAPHCWAPSQRVRKFLTTLDPQLDLTADTDASPKIYDFVINHVGAERALFDGDFDLPLQIVTRRRHRARLNEWFERSGLGPPEFGDEPGNDEDYA